MMAANDDKPVSADGPMEAEAVIRFSPLGTSISPRKRPAGLGRRLRCADADFGRRGFR
jgi:hypothetical protein